MTVAGLLWGVVFGSLGLGFFSYGARQKAVVPLSCGAGLMIYPYFMPNTIVLVLVGLVLVVIPYFVKI
jgi:hypothetical protein